MSAGVWENLRELVAGLDLLLAGAAGAGIGFIGKFILEQWSFRAAARREFAGRVTSQISELANDHYWNLANHAGVLAGILEEYIKDRTYHMLLIWDQPKELAIRIDELAKESADNSFQQFCRLIGYFDSFQFKGGNSYLLTDHTSGEACKRLYNSLVATLPPDLNVANVYQLEVPDGTGQNQPKIPITELSAEALTEAINNHLSAEKEAWTNWFRFEVAGVNRAAEMLRAYNELLNHELVLLYRHWFRNRPQWIGFAGLNSVDKWPDLLTDQSFEAIRESSFESVLLRPLGTAVTVHFDQSPKLEPAPADSGRQETGASPPVGDSFR